MKQRTVLQSEADITRITRHLEGMLEAVRGMSNKIKFEDKAVVVELDSESRNYRFLARVNRGNVATRDSSQNSLESLLGIQRDTGTVNDGLAQLRELAGK